MAITTSIYDALLGRLQAVFPNHARLPNPYQIEENSGDALRLGYGLAYAAATNTERNLSCQLSLSRNYIVTLTRRVFGNEFDADSRAASEVDLFEDQRLLINDVESDPTLGDSANVLSGKFLSDSGLQFILGESDRFIMVRSVIAIEYFEDVN